MAKKNIWSQHDLTAYEIKKIKIGDLTLFFHLLKDEIKIAHLYSEDDKNISSKNDSQQDLEWKRWPINREVITIQIDPALPDRPLLVKPESTFYLSGHFESNVYIRFPVSLKISLVHEKEMVELMNILPVKLSNTWFGTFKEGEICYSISSGFRTEITPDIKRPFMTICRLKLKNDADEDLTIDKICLRSDHLSLFTHESQLWTDEVTIIYTHKNQESEVVHSGKAPAHLKEATLTAKPGIIEEKSFYARSFSTIKDLAGAGLFSGK